MHNSVICTSENFLQRWDDGMDGFRNTFNHEIQPKYGAKTKNIGTKRGQMWIYHKVNDKIKNSHQAIKLLPTFFFTSISAKTDFFGKSVRDLCTW